MEIFKALVKLFKGGSHAERTEESVSGGNGRERRILHSIPSICERAVSDIRGIRVLAAACADERSRDTGALSSDPIRRESCALIAAAKRIGDYTTGLQTLRLDRRRDCNSGREERNQSRASRRNRPSPRRLSPQTPAIPRSRHSRPAR